MFRSAVSHLKLRTLCRLKFNDSMTITYTELSRYIIWLGDWSNASSVVLKIPIKPIDAKTRPLLSISIFLQYWPLTKIPLSPGMALFADDDRWIDHFTHCAWALGNNPSITKRSLTIILLILFFPHLKGLFKHHLHQSIQKGRLADRETCLQYMK